jgi:hypothetical protein
MNFNGIISYLILRKADLDPDKLAKKSKFPFNYAIEVI